MLWSLLAGVGGTLAGALIPVSVRGRGEKLLSALMAFTAGFMAALVFLDVLPESLDSTGQIWITLLVTLAGAGIVFLAGILLDRKAGEHRHDDSVDLPDLHSAEGKRELYVGFSLMTALILHNIPEGIAIAVPIFYATGNRKKAFMYSLFSGLAEPVGALIGFLILMPFLSATLLAVLFAIVAGIMIYITFDELLPMAETYGQHHIVLAGLLLGMLGMGAVMEFM